MIFLGNTRDLFINRMLLWQGEVMNAEGFMCNEITNPHVNLIGNFAK